MNNADKENILSRWRFILFICLWLTMSILTGCATYISTRDNAINKPDERMEEKLGIKIEGIRLSAAGYMLDFRYRVINPEKAALLLDNKTKPHLIDQESGAKFAVPSPPKVGSLRATGPVLADRTYFILFANPGKFIKKGSKVTVVIGDFRLENLIVD